MQAQKQYTGLDVENKNAATLFNPYVVPEGVLKLRAAIQRLNRVIQQEIRIPAKRSQPSALLGQSQRSKSNVNMGKDS